MITVGCAGFAVPATRYFKEYDFVEIQETHRATPGPGTVRRWRREAPQGFQFALVGPRELGQEAFRGGPLSDVALQTLSEIATQLEARTAVVLAPSDFASSRPNKAALKEFLKSLKQAYSTVVFELGSTWDPEDSDALAEDTETIAARDPLHTGTSKRGVAYYRLPGPAGHKSRYEDPAIDRLAEIAAQASGQTAHYVFTNVDMFADGKRFKKALGV
jgi:uncharacterized protein YecE (DUF72 family)